MSKTRRDFLKLAGACACTVAASQLVAGDAAASDAHGHAPAVAQPGHQHEHALHGTHWAMVIDTKRFADPLLVQKCVDACHITHNVPKIDGDQEIKWIWAANYLETFTEHNHYLPQNVEDRSFMLLCNHCENPPCVRVCPTKATFKRSWDGIVQMDMHRCIGCRFCMAACPYGARSFNFNNPRPYLDEAKMNPNYPTRMRGVVEKCTFCVERLAQGLMPACVEASDGAILFGDLDDPHSAVRKALASKFTVRRKVSLGTEPSVYYII
ncbi:sulfate reduction electron transfer complex DsrMKJOP subunit DsrO [Megalodesulfovibrio paquesii]